MTLKLIHCQLHTPRSRPLSRPQSSQAFIHVTYSTPSTRFLALLYQPPPPFTLQPFQKPLQLFPRFLNLPPYPTYLILQLFHPPTPPSSQSPYRVQQPHPLIPPPHSLRDPFYSFLNLSLPPHCDKLPPYSLTHRHPPQSSPPPPPPHSNPIPVPLYSPISASFSPHTPPSFPHSSAPPTSP